MKIIYAVRYTDGTTGAVELEKPPGAHPTSIDAAVAAILAAEKTGKRVDRLGWANPRGSVSVGILFEDITRSRAEVLETFKKGAPQRFRTLFGSGN